MKGTAKVFFVFGCLNLAFAIGLGAAGAHALKAQLAATDPDNWFMTALHYHQIHSIGLILTGIIMQRFSSNRWFVASGGLMVAGTVLFCGGLYLLSLKGIRPISGGIPAGGIAFIGAWLAMAMGGAKTTHHEAEKA